MHRTELIHGAHSIFVKQWLYISGHFQNLVLNGLILIREKCIKYFNLKISIYLKTGDFSTVTEKEWAY